MQLLMFVMMIPIAAEMIASITTFVTLDISAFEKFASGPSVKSKHCSMKLISIITDYFIVIR